MRPVGRGAPNFLITSPDWSARMIQPPTTVTNSAMARRRTSAGSAQSQPRDSAKTVI